MKTCLESRQETGPKAEKGEGQEEQQDRRQNNERADRKMESNDSPEIPDREETSETFGLPSGKNEVEARKRVDCICLVLRLFFPLLVYLSYVLLLSLQVKRTYVVETVMHHLPVCVILFALIIITFVVDWA